VELLLGRGADPDVVDAAGRSALIAAVAKGHDAVVRTLQSHGAMR
jgi:ankyrin repeat protein